MDKLFITVKDQESNDQLDFYIDDSSVDIWEGSSPCFRLAKISDDDFQKIVAAWIKKRIAKRKAERNK